ncbi:MAG: heme ABC transporter ATP-binding protein [Bdellovibrionales bacterium]|jgi:iron complex transport system ATP-binding protein|nr:heme ABC transporter ATP-binding protein [Bdellovibrionales bacterium]
MTTLLSAQDVSFRIENRDLVHKVNLNLRAGEIVAVIGRNGAGKTTLLRLLTGDLKPSQGHVSVFGQPIETHSLKELAKNRAVLSQSTPLHFDFRVFEVVLLGRTPHQHSHRESQTDIQIAKHCLTQVGLAGFENRQYLTLSGGEQQRVQLARALAQITAPDQATDTESQASLLFLDEPTSSLDISHQHKILQVARARVDQSQHGHALGVFAILHDINLAAQYADRILVLSQGQRLAFGPSAEVLNSDLLSEAFQHPITVIDHPTAAGKLVVT